MIIYLLRFRQVEKSERAPSSGLNIPLSLGGNSNSQNEQTSDLSWHSVNVASQLHNSATIQNLSQDSSYEFYVQAKNIIGDGPRSQLVQAHTRRAISGSLTPVSVSPEPSEGQQHSGKWKSMNFSLAALFSSLRLLCAHLNSEPL